jgi:hypothetical protein
VWAAGAVAGAALIALFFGTFAAGGGGGDPFTEPAFNTTSSTSTSSSSTTAPASFECVEVANPSLLITIDADAASAVVVDDRWWFVAKANGATWLTDADVTTDAAGELLPVNDQARIDSESRRDVALGDPRYEGHTDDEPEAGAARACALGDA